MDVKFGCICRGDDNSYIQLLIENAPDDTSISVEVLSTEGHLLPSQSYHDDHGETENTSMVVLVPFFDVQKFVFSVEARQGTGIALDSARLELDSKSLIWKSRLNYRTQAGECGRIKGIPAVHEDRFPDIHFSAVYRKQTSSVWRGVILSSDEAELEPFAVDMRGNNLDFEFSIDESQLTHGDRAYPMPLLRQIFSLAIAEAISSFVLAVKSKTTNQVVGYAEMSEAAAADLWEDNESNLRTAANTPWYSDWFSRHRAVESVIREQQKQLLDYQPLMRIVCVQRDATSSLAATLDSLLVQSYRNWELIVDSGFFDEQTTAISQGDQRIKPMQFDKDLNAYAKLKKIDSLSPSEFVALVNCGDIIEPDALFCFAQAINSEDDVDVLYCDEDSTADSGECHSPVFKPEFNLDLLYAHNYIGHLLVVRSALIHDYFASESQPDDGGLDYDIALFASEHARNIKCIPRVLYHVSNFQRDVPAGSDSGLDPAVAAENAHVLQRHLNERGIDASVEAKTPYYRNHVIYELPCPHPLVSIIIPNMDHIDLLSTCIESIESQATYDSYEIIVVENNSKDSKTFDYYETASRNHGNIKIVTWKESFNYSKVINYGAEHSSGDYLLFLNNDTKVITPNFIEELLGPLMREEVGVVGPKLLFRNGLIQHAGVQVGPYDSVVHVHQFLAADMPGYCGRALCTGDFSAVTGACQMIRRAAFDKVGGYCEDFAVGFNDIDFCLRLRKAGYLVVFTPFAMLYHYEFASRGREANDVQKMTRWQQERALFIQRWPEFFVTGDPYGNPNLKKDSLYFAL